MYNMNDNPKYNILMSGNVRILENAGWILRWYFLGLSFIFYVTKLSNISFSMECFTADFSRNSCTNFKVCFLGDRLGTGHQIEKFQGSSWNLIISWSNLLSFKLFDNSWNNFLPDIPVHSLSWGDNPVLFHLRWRETLLNHEKI